MDVSSGPGKNGPAAAKRRIDRQISTGTRCLADFSILGLDYRYIGPSKDLAVG